MVATGEDGNDALTIVDPDGSLFAPTKGSTRRRRRLGRRARDHGRHGERPGLHGGATPDAGTLTHIGDAGTQSIDFAGIAPITDTVAAAASPSSAPRRRCDRHGRRRPRERIPDHPVSAPAFESIHFANRTGVTIISNGGADTLTFNDPTPAAGLSTLNVTNVGAVTQAGAVNYTNLSLNNITGAVTLTGSNDVTSLSALLTGSGNGFSFNDVDDIALTSVGLVNGISTSNGAIAITTAVAPSSSSTRRQAPTSTPAPALSR